MLVVPTVGAGALVDRWRAVLEAGSHVAGGEEEEARTVAGSLDGEEEDDGGKQAACKQQPVFWGPMLRAKLTALYFYLGR